MVAIVMTENVITTIQAPAQPEVAERSHNHDSQRTSEKNANNKHRNVDSK